MHCVCVGVRAGGQTLEAAHGAYACLYADRHNWTWFSMHLTVPVAALPLPCSRTPPSLFHQVDDVVMVMEEALRPAACGVAARLRNAGRSVDLVLEPKKLKWAFKAAERAGAARLLLVGGEEWERGAVAVRDLAARSQEEVPLDQL